MEARVSKRRRTVSRRAEDEYAASDDDDDNGDDSNVGSGDAYSEGSELEEKIEDEEGEEGDMEDSVRAPAMASKQIPCHWPYCTLPSLAT